MTYKHKMRVNHILDDLDRGYIKTKKEMEEALDQIDKETYKEYFLEEYDQNKQSEEEQESEEEDSDVAEFK